MKLAELQPAELGAGRVGEDRPAPIAPHGLVVRRQSAAPPPVVSTVAAPRSRPVGDRARAALAVAPQGDAERPRAPRSRARRRPARPAGR